jgi:hypothetical protein
MKKVKIKLDTELYHDWGTVMKCCGKTKWFNKGDLEPGNMWNCTDCGKLLLVVDHEGVAYYVGSPVFDRKRT